MKVARCWATPAQDDRRVALPAAVGGVAQTFDQQPSGLFEIVGHYNCIDVAIDCPLDWLDVTLRMSARIGGIDVPVDVVRVADLELPFVAPTRIAGLAFSIRGRTCDRFYVEAWRTEVDHGEITIGGQAWGEGDIHGDRARRLPIDTWCSPGQTRTFTTGLAGLAAGTTVALAANPLPRGRVAVTDLEWTSTDAGGVTLVLQEVDPLGVITVRGAWQSRAGGAGEPTLVRMRRQPPMYSGPGARWEFVQAGGLAANNLVQLHGFDT